MLGLLCIFQLSLFDSDNVETLSGFGDGCEGNTKLPRFETPFYLGKVLFCCTAPFSFLQDSFNLILYKVFAKLFFAWQELSTLSARLAFLGGIQSFFKVVRIVFRL